MLDKRMNGCFDISIADQGLTCIKRVTHQMSGKDTFSFRRVYQRPKRGQWLAVHSSMTPIPVQPVPFLHHFFCFLCTH